MRGRYLEIDRPHRLVLSWVADHNGHETLLSIDLQRDGAGTLLTLRHDGFPTHTSATATEAVGKAQTALWTNLPGLCGHDRDPLASAAKRPHAQGDCDG